MACREYEISSYCGECLTDSIVDSFKGIYMSSFPPSERMPIGDLVENVRRESSILHTCEDNGEVVAFTITSHIARTGIHLLAYMAVGSSRRGEGIGSALFQHVRNELRGNTNNVGIVVEVESTNAVLDKTIMDQRLRRTAFYRDNGASAIDCVTDYRIPSLSGEGVLQMQLLWVPLFGARQLCGPPLREVVRLILTDVYGVQQGSDLLRRVLSSVVC